MNYSIIIQSCSLIIADLSSANINVYHEIGYAMVLDQYPFVLALFAETLCVGLVAVIVPIRSRVEWTGKNRVDGGTFKKNRENLPLMINSIFARFL